MPEVMIKIGGREFSVVCQPGEEASLEQASSYVDREASLLVASSARITEERLLLLSSLMLADKFCVFEKQQKELEDISVLQQKKISSLEDRLLTAATELQQRDLFASNPSPNLVRLDELAQGLEVLATKLESDNNN